MEITIGHSIPHLKNQLLSRFHGFFLCLLESPSPEVQTIARLSARDVRTNIGANLRFISENTGLDPWAYGLRRIREELDNRTYKVVPENERWKIPYFQKIISERLFAFYNGDRENEDKLTMLIQSLVTT